MLLLIILSKPLPDHRSKKCGVVTQHYDYLSVDHIEQAGGRVKFAMHNYGRALSGIEKSTQAGQGIGLADVKGFVESHGGLTVWRVPQVAEPYLQSIFRKIRDQFFLDGARLVNEAKKIRLLEISTSGRH